MKKIVLFSDGTGNSPASPQKTNVWRAYKALDQTPGSNQIAFYDDGVGTSRFKPGALLGQAFGWGLARNVRQIYGFLCRTYNDGDEIYGFGFSRGAFTMRVAVALIAGEGIIDRNIARDDRDLDRLITAAYREFRKKNFTPSLLSFFFQPLRDASLNAWYRATGRTLYDCTKNIRHKDPSDHPKLIKFVGVWDTVDAYGLPVDELTRAWDKVVWPLTAKDRDLSPRVKRACQALALDEQRESFEPMLWNEKAVPPAATLSNPVNQVWFPGVHSNVGGSYPDDALALVALNWMLDESEKDDGLTYLDCERRRYREQANACGRLYDNRSGVGAYYRYAPRKLERLCDEKKPGLANWLKTRIGLENVEQNEVRIATPLIHHSVFDRLAASDNYAPINIPGDYAVVLSDGTVAGLPRPGKDAVAGLENAADAGRRRERQSLVWNKVWGRKVLYFLMLFLTLVFVAYPYAPFLPSTRIASVLEPLFGTFSALIRSIPHLVGKIPGLGFAEGWAERYAQAPYVFSLGLLVIGGLLLWSIDIGARLRSEMRINWHHLTHTGAAPAGNVPAWRTRLAGFLEGNAYANWIERPIRIGLEALAVILFVVAVLVVCSRLVFTVSDGFGGICEEMPDAGEGRTLGQVFTFDPKSPCFDTGLTVRRNETYAIRMQVHHWKDATIDADANGWIDPPWYLYLFTPVRRHLFAGWYQPVARVDPVMFDRHPLAADVPPDAGDEARMDTLEATFVAHRSGRLFLYLNDAVLFWPALVPRFYENNEGYACVKVMEASHGAAEAAAEQGSGTTAADMGMTCDPP